MGASSSRDSKGAGDRTNGKRDWWDSLTKAWGIIFALVGFLAAQYYNKHEARLQEIQTVEKFYHYLISDNKRERQMAIVTIGQLTNPELATKLVAASAPPEESAETVAMFGVQDVISMSKDKDRQISRTALNAQDKIFSAPDNNVNAVYADPDPSLKGSAQAVSTGWAYLGDYSSTDNVWRTRYFEFKKDQNPYAFAGKQNLRVRKETGSLNVRAGMPTPDASFPSVVEVLKSGSEVTILEVKPWEATGFMWARITYTPRRE